MTDDPLARRPPVWHYEEEPQPDGMILHRPVLDAESRAELDRIMAEAAPPDFLDAALARLRTAVKEWIALSPAATNGTFGMGHESGRQAALAAVLDLIQQEADQP